VTQAVFFEQIDWGQALMQWPWASFQVVLLALFWAVLLMAVSLPVSCLLPFIAMGGPTAGRIGLFLFGLLLLWLLFPLLLSPHGIFLNGRKMWASVQDGFRLTRVTYPYTMLLFIMILVLSQGLNLLWTLPPASSWLALVGIFGHAFVATGLLAATLIYYREATRWMQRVQQQIKLLST
jgi:hypothetical protein